MKKISYIIKSPYGIHARPAAKLSQLVLQLKCEVVVRFGAKAANASDIIELMGLSANEGDEVIVEVSGENEAEALDNIRSFLEQNL